MRLAIAGMLVLAAVSASRAARELLRRLAVPTDPDAPEARGRAATSADDVPPGDTAAARDRCSAQPTSGLAGLGVALCAAVLFAGLTARIGPALVLAAYCWLAAATVPLAWIDAAVHRLPDVLTGAAYAGTVLLLLAAAARADEWGALLRAVAGGLVLAAAYLAVAFIHPAGMGLGDVKLSASLGTALAWIGWRTLLAGTFAGFVLAGCYGAVLLARHRATLKQHIPLGPFVIAGTFLVLIAVGQGSHLL